MKKMILSLSLIISAVTLSSCGDPALSNLINRATQVKEGSNSTSSSNSSTSSGTSGSVSAGVIIDASAAATFSGLKASNCSEEGTIKSATGASTYVMFKNKTESDISVYWLNAQGKRQLYKKLSAGQSHNQQTFVTHPWLIANAQDACVGIYTPESASNSTLDVTSQGSGSGSTSSSTSSSTSGSASGSVSVGAAAATPERVQQAITCLKAKGDTSNAQTLTGLLNIYTSMSKVLGAEVAAKAYLTNTPAIMEKTGC
ncbi:MAG: hypothetical protein IV090_12895 [Candidatus Sericytochromatia bacterium]|nr:hypothetical protein [Candidatus Sericytochromatia bacterium]